MLLLVASVISRPICNAAFALFGDSASRLFKASRPRAMAYGMIAQTTNIPTDGNIFLNQLEDFPVVLDWELLVADGEAWGPVKEF